jgi:uncharacterized protein
MSQYVIRPVPPGSLERLLIDGPVGAIETDLNAPAGEPKGLALIAHPHPLQGGTKDNKVVTTLAKAFYNLGCITARPNFRGVGASAGAHDEGRGEKEDLLRVADYLRGRYGDLPLTLAGFSFGSFVQTRVVKSVAARELVLVAPAVTRFPAERVPAHTLVIHGERDDVVPLEAVLHWARPQALPIVVVPGGEHFFHGRLGLLAQLIVRYCR